MAERAKKKKKKQESPSLASINVDDRISPLPDSLLLHILSFLPMHHVIDTSLLSRRWRYLWTSVPNLDFDSEAFGNKPEIVKFINLILMHYEAPKIRKFRVSLDARDVEHSYIDSWLRFAMRHDVEDLDMDFSYGYWIDDAMFDEEDMRYRMPRCLFKCKELKTLSLSFCHLNLPSSFHFQSLKKLRLYHVELTDLDASGCPLLEELIMNSCNSMGILNIHAPNPRLRNMKIQDSFDVIEGDSELVIHAPYLLFIEISGLGSMRKRYHIKNLSSITSATLEFTDVDDYLEALKLVELLKNLSHSKTFKLRRKCIQVLSFMEAQSLETPRLCATCLELEINVNRRDLPGITNVLRNSSGLESLTINISRESHSGMWMLLSDYHPDESKCWELFELVLSSQPQIKIVKINHLLECKKIPSGSPKIDLRDYLKGTKKEIRLIELLLKWCNVLDKIIIRTTTLHVLGNWSLKTQFILNVTKKILAFPRASATAKIYFS